MAGHSKWSNIKHRKGAQDAKRGKANTRLIREIMVAAKAGGADKATNAMLRLAVERANKANVTKDSIERAILKATGQLQGEELFEITYEGYGSHGVAIWVHCLTDNKNRTVSEVRHAFNKYGGTLGTGGSVAYMFERVAKIVCDTQDLDSVMEAVLAFDVRDVDLLPEGVLVIADSDQLNQICQHLSENTSWPILESEVTLLTTAPVGLTEKQAESAGKLIDVLENIEDVQSVYSNMTIS